MSLYAQILLFLSGVVSTNGVIRHTVGEMCPCFSWLRSKVRPFLDRSDTHRPLCLEDSTNSTKRSPDWKMHVKIIKGLAGDLLEFDLINGHYEERSSSSSLSRFREALDTHMPAESGKSNRIVFGSTVIETLGDWEQMVSVLDSDYFSSSHSPNFHEYAGNQSSAECVTYVVNVSVIQQRSQSIGDILRVFHQTHHIPLYLERVASDEEFIHLLGKLVPGRSRDAMMVSALSSRAWDDPGNYYIWYTWYTQQHLVRWDPGIPPVSPADMALVTQFVEDELKPAALPASLRYHSWEEYWRPTMTISALRFQFRRRGSRNVIMAAVEYDHPEGFEGENPQRPNGCTPELEFDLVLFD